LSSLPTCLSRPCYGCAVPAEHNYEHVYCVTMTFAIAGALETLSRRLRARLLQAKELDNLEEELNEDFEELDEMAEEWGEEDTTPEPL
jgi:hypothetical protein